MAKIERGGTTPIVRLKSWRFTNDEIRKSLTYGYVGMLRGPSFNALVVSLIRWGWRASGGGIFTTVSLVLGNGEKIRKIEFARKNSFLEPPISPLNKR